MKHPRLFLKRKIHIRKTQGLSGKSSLSGDLSMLYLCKHAVPIWPVTFLPRSCKIKWLVPSPGPGLVWWDGGKAMRTSGGRGGGWVHCPAVAGGAQWALPTRHHHPPLHRTTTLAGVTGVTDDIHPDMTVIVSSCHRVIMTSWHGDTNLCYTTYCLTVNRVTLFRVFLNKRSNLLVLVVQEGEGNWLTRQIFKSEPWHYILCFCSFVWFKIQVDHNNE